MEACYCRNSGYITFEMSKQLNHARVHIEVHLWLVCIFLYRVIRPSVSGLVDPSKKTCKQRRCESLTERCLPSWPCHMVLVKKPAPGEDAAVWWQEVHRHSSMAKQDRRGMQVSLLQCKNNRPNMSACSMTETNEWENKNGKGQQWPSD